MADPRDIVVSFLEMWNEPGGIKKSILTYFTDDSIYENIGMSKTTGIQENVKFIEWYQTQSSGGWWRAQVLAIAVADNKVMTERIDYMIDGQGKPYMVIRVMGIFEIKDDKILAWRDYFDTRSVPIYDGPGSLE